MAPPDDDGGTPIVRYRVYRGASPDDLSLHDVVEPEGASYADTGNPSNQTCHYVVTAVNIVGESDRSGGAAARTFDYPGAPMTVRAQSGVQLRQIDPSWNAPAYDGGTPVTAYRVWRHDGDGKRGVVGETLAPPFTDRDLLPAITYHYRVTAENIVGVGKPSGDGCDVATPWPPLIEQELCECATTVPTGVPEV